MSIEKIKLYIECIAIVAAGIFGFYRFVYEDYIVPSRFSPFILTEGILEKIENKSENDSICYIKMTLKIENNSSKKINIVYLKYTVKGLIYSSGGSFDSNLPFEIKYLDKNWFLNYDERDGAFDTQYCAHKIDKLECGTFFQYNWLDQGDKDSRTFVVAIPKKYTTASLTTELYYTKEDLPKTFSQNQLVAKDCDLENLLSEKSIDPEKFYPDCLENEQTSIMEEYKIVVSKSQYELLISPSQPKTANSKTMMNKKA